MSQLVQSLTTFLGAQFKNKLSSLEMILTLSCLLASANKPSVCNRAQQESGEDDYSNGTLTASTFLASNMQTEKDMRLVVYS